MIQVRIDADERSESFANICTMKLTNKYCNWQFSCGNWRVTHEGTYKRAAAMACTMFKNHKRTKFGMIFVKVLPFKSKNPKPHQEQLNLLRNI